MGVPRRRRRRSCAAIPAAPRPDRAGPAHPRAALTPLWTRQLHAVRVRVRTHAGPHRHARASACMYIWLEQRACSSASSSLGCAASSSDCMNVIIAACAALASAEAGAARRCDGASNPTCDAKRGSRGQGSHEHSKTGATLPAVTPGMRPCTTHGSRRGLRWAAEKEGDGPRGCSLGRGAEGGREGRDAGREGYCWHQFSVQR